MKVSGSSTGKFLPTGNLTDIINDIPVTCMDVAMPMVIARAEDFGLTGYETREALDANEGFLNRMEQLRIKAGILMGMGDVSKSVTPKFGLLAPARDGGTISTRYFMPWSTHPTMAVTGQPMSCILCFNTWHSG
jgi:2-methylaconitate cis-trans-isomerase PrpF